MSKEHRSTKNVKKPKKDAPQPKAGGSDRPVAPMTSVIPNQLRLRDDVVTDGGVRDAVLANAPAAEHGFFGVPKVIE